jgi:hypothetical protein
MSLAGRRCSTLEAMCHDAVLDCDFERSARIRRQMALYLDTARRITLNQDVLEQDLFQLFVAHR